MNNEVIIICESMYHGNTMQLSQAMGCSLNCKVVSADEAASMNLTQYKVIGLGSGIYFTAHHPKIIDIVKKLSSSQKTFVFSTHGAPFLGNYHDSINAKLAEKRIAVLGEFSSKGFDCTGPFIIIGGVNKGRPNEKDEKNGVNFITRILPNYIKDLSLVPKGHFVHVNDACVTCFKCIDVCPMNVFAVKSNNIVAVNEKECIHCSLCQKNCPTQSIALNHSITQAIKIAQRHAKRKSLYLDQ